MEKEEYYPSINGAIGLLAVYVLVCPIIPFLLLFITSKLIGFSIDNPLIYSIETTSSFFLLVLWINRKHSINFKSLFSLDKVSIRYILPICFSILGLNIILSEINNIQIIFLPLTDFWKNAFEGFSNDFIGTSIVAPIIEEVLVRGIILRGLLMKYSVKKSIIVSALLFAIIHMNPWQFLGAFLGGIILGWLYVKTRSIVPCILGHALNNSLEFIITLIGLNIPGFSNSTNVIEHQPIWFDLLGVIFLVTGVMWLTKLFNKQRLSFISKVSSVGESDF
ncbi:lysostaphin resistance A-like protein [Clostridium sp.]|jgi:membrane protease YdiL (CAAX protease family)|uniref:CPBP family intramembrane glutamic endopeptidase n=1 Tax=Clostridium sp. TaxID=1506 RepID=UPI003EE9A08E